MTCLRVLIIDDSVTIRAMLEQMIADAAGCVVAGVAANAEDAHRLMLTSRPDVMTLDLTMPGIGGLQFIRDLRDRPHPPIIVVSSSSKDGAAESHGALEAGASACFDKAKLLSDFSKFLRILKKIGGEASRRGSSVPAFRAVPFVEKRIRKFTIAEKEQAWTAR
jgi:chemotaxis response regulator CheB